MVTKRIPCQAIPHALFSITWDTGGMPHSWSGTVCDVPHKVLREQDFALATLEFSSSSYCPLLMSRFLPMQDNDGHKPILSHHKAPSCAHWTLFLLFAMQCPRLRKSLKQRCA